jgi:hypothetical protein
MKLKHEKGDPKSLTLLDKNARFMRHETFQTLVKNIKKDGALSQWPFVHHDVETDQRIVWSGNHRVKAAIEAGLTKIDWIESDERMTKDQLVSLQLSHNSINGEDDPTLLAELYESIDDVDLRLYAGLDDKTLELLDEVSVGALGEANLDYQTIAFMFLPSEAENAKKAMTEAMNVMNAEQFWTAAYGQYEPALDALNDIRGAHKIGNQAVALNILLGIFRRHVTDLSDAWILDDDTPAHTGDVPISSVVGYTMPAKEATQVVLALRRAEKDGAIENKWQVLQQWAEQRGQKPPKPNAEQKNWHLVSDLLGTERIPPDAAQIVHEALEHMVADEDVSEEAKWKALEYWAADYIAGT